MDAYETAKSIISMGEGDQAATPEKIQKLTDSMVWLREINYLREEEAKLECVRGFFVVEVSRRVNGVLTKTWATLSRHVENRLKSLTLDLTDLEDIIGYISVETSSVELGEEDYTSVITEARYIPSKNMGYKEYLSMDKCVFVGIDFEAIDERIMKGA